MIPRSLLRGGFIPGAAPQDAAAEVGLGHETALPTHDLVERAVREVGRGQVAGGRVDRVCPTFYTRGSSGICGPFSINAAMSRDKYLIA